MMPETPSLSSNHTRCKTGKYFVFEDVKVCHLSTVEKGSLLQPSRSELFGPKFCSYQKAILARNFCSLIMTSRVFLSGITRSSAPLCC
ncbi:hypothetical protein ONE63_011148 [Megalurothrips usitatus]|uniref:Uncharacterized protein n=1 Tax=Megalurothrips usitatus TaxID=439358 RepID=A0AAV7XJT6_9NEOP|nr:hypothetical protein ONE63_011148 [Megalurothrips usitatus]